MTDPFEPAAAREFVYDHWDHEGGVVSCVYRLDGLTFEERFRFPEGVEANAAFERAIELLFVCAGVSYFKAAAPPVVRGVPEWAEPFARQLYLDGLGEYAMVNHLEPIRPTFVPGSRARSGLTGAHIAPENAGWARAGGPALVAVGGGKDSVVTAESLRRAGRAAVLGSVNTHPAIEATAEVGGFEHLVVGRRIDPLLLELNGRGARNGHVPVTAINSCALAALAAGIGASAVVMSNESSASVPIAEHRGRPVNHQWSKSLECERWLASLLPVPYFSLLRPLHEVEIARRFSTLPRYFDVVTSCNQAYTGAGRVAGVRWCGQCPKCRFVFLALAPFLDASVMRGIFAGADLLNDPAAIEPYRAIVGLGGEPPLECVGTTRESRWAMARLSGESEWSQHPVVRALAPVVTDVAGWDPLAERGEHLVPEEWTAVADALA